VSLDLDALDSLLSTHRDTIGCFIIDTYQVRFCSAAIIGQAIDLCKRNKILVVSDETKIAGRILPLGLASRFGWNVDFIVVGKALANGAPLSILLGRRDLMAVSEEARITGTFSQELTAVFSALATFDEMLAVNGYSLLRNIGERIADTLNRAIANAGLRSSLHVESLFGGEMFEAVFNRNMLEDWDSRQRLCSALADNGVLLLQGHPSYVCLAHAALDHESLLARAQRGLTQWSATAANPRRPGQSAIDDGRQRNAIEAPCSEDTNDFFQDSHSA
jgi:glutamate-1-semialdehyde 2,1-aminomutase